MFDRVMVGIAIGACLGSLGSAAVAADSSLQAEVSQRGAQVMPFALKATTHIFIKTLTGGVQKVVVKNARDSHQIRLIRTHLASIAKQFGKGDFSAPAQIHGMDMPGLTVLRQTKPGDVMVHYQALENGAQIRYSSQKPELVQALHQWFDAQLSDHGADAMEGHEHDGMMYTP